MQTRDEVEGLYNCREFSQPLELASVGIPDQGIVHERTRVVITRFLSRQTTRGLGNVVNRNLKV